MNNDSTQSAKPPLPDSEILNGIVEIAAFLKVTNRTVTGLIGSAALPVCRLGLGKASTKTAITNWLTRRAEGRIDG
jgi:hypothetical protein